MAHVAKYTRYATGRILGHYNRQKDDGVTRSNESIDPARTEQNYYFKHGTMKTLNERLSQVKVCKRADVNVLCDWVVTLPKNVVTEDERKFFEAVFDFLSERYGAANVINAVVHKDETTPHMHCAFVPVVEDKKKGGYKVSAKELLDRTELQTFHSDLSAYVQQQIGYEVAILNGATVDGNLSKKELLEKDIEELEQKKEALKAENTELETEIAEKTAEKEKITGKILKAEEVVEKNYKKCFGGGVKVVKKNGETASTTETIEYMRSVRKTASRVLTAEKERDEATERSEIAEKNEAAAKAAAEAAEEKAEAAIKEMQLVKELCHCECRIVSQREYDKLREAGISMQIKNTNNKIIVRYSEDEHTKVEALLGLPKTQKQGQKNFPNRSYGRGR